MTYTDGTPSNYLILLTYSSGTSSHNLSPLKGWPCQARYEDAAPPLSYSGSDTAHPTGGGAREHTHMHTYTSSYMLVLYASYLHLL